MGAAFNYSSCDIKNFVKSFRMFNTSADLVLIAHRDNFDEISSFLKDYNGKCLLYASALYSSYKIHNIRFFKFLDYLAHQKELYRNVILSDVADVFFQSDPFANAPEEFIYFFEEDPAETIGQNKYNKQWVRFCYGKKGLKALYDKTIVCAGTTFGSFGNVYVYLNHVVDEMLRLFKSQPKEMHKRYVDQGIQNYLAHQKMHLFRHPELKQNGDITATISITLRKSPASITVEGNHVVVNGQKPAIVHQYNRSEKIKEIVDNMYSID